MSPPSRILPFACYAPAWNMAVDEALLRLADRPTLRLFGWSPPAVSLGRFQPGRENLEPLATSGLVLVRRMTGGGAIVHWHELTYSFVLPTTHPLVAGLTTLESYDAVHAPIREALHTLGVEAVSRPGGAAALSSRRPVLCFHRITAFDLVAGGLKLVGSAQRRLRHRMLQHGSLILETNPFQRGTASLRTLLGRPVAPAEVAQALAAAFSRRLGPLEEAPLTAEEERLARRLAAGYAVDPRSLKP